MFPDTELIKLFIHIYNFIHMIHHLVNVLEDYKKKKKNN